MATKIRVEYNAVLSKTFLQSVSNIFHPLPKNSAQESQISVDK